VSIKDKYIFLLAAAVLAVVLFMALIKGNHRLDFLISKRDRIDRAASLSNQAVILSRQGEYERAVPLLERAWELAPEESLLAENLSMLYCNLGFSLNVQGKYDRSLEITRRVLTKFPENPGLSCARGESFYYLNRVDSAIYYFDKALAGKPSDPALSERINRLKEKCRQEAGFETSYTGNFDIRFEGGQNLEVADKVLGLLDRIRDRQGAQLGWHPQHSISVVLYSQKQFSDVTNISSWAGAAFDGKIRVPIADFVNDDNLLNKILTHEFIHAVLFEIAGEKFPGWFNEGLAQYQEGIRAVEVEYLPLAALAGSFIKLDQAKARKAYAASLSAVSFLIEDNGWDMARLFINKMGQADNFDAVFKENFGITIEQFEEKWKSSKAGTGFKA
jgi:tetratricopeptide (TPR) repeat protein